MSDSLKPRIVFLLCVALGGCAGQDASAPAPEALALHVDAPGGEAFESLPALASSVDWTAPTLPLNSASVEYYSGVSHSLGGVLPKGRVDKNRPPNEPLPQGSFVHEFHRDADGLLAVVVQVTKDGEAIVSSRMIYDAEDRPIGRLSFGSHGDFVHYDEQGQPDFALRVKEDGTVLGGLKPISP